MGYDDGCTGYRMTDHKKFLWRICSAREQSKRLEICERNITNCYPPVSLDEHVAVQRVNKLRPRFGGKENQRDKMRKRQRLKPSSLQNSLAMADNDDIQNEVLKSTSCFSLELDVREWSYVRVKAAAAPTHSAFIGAAASSGSKLNYSNQQSIVPSVSQTSGCSDSIMECVLHSFVAENEPDQDMIYEDTLTRNVKTVDDKARSQNYNKTGEVEKVYGMMAGLHADNGGADVSEAAAEFGMMEISPKAYQHAVKTLESQKDWYHKTQMALEEKIRVLSANLENTTNTLSYTEKLHDQAQKEKKEWKVKFEETFLVPIDNHTILSKLSTINGFEKVFTMSRLLWTSHFSSKEYGK
ncbi:hypothetical protein Tco_0854126 [Tanacetum coccineum]